MGAGIGGANIKKTIYYLQRNGVRKTWNAVRERLEARNAPPYVWMPPSKEELERPMIGAFRLLQHRGSRL